MKDRTLRSLVGRPHQTRDALAWLAAGDWYEAAGDADQAALWRARAKWFPVLFAQAQLSADKHNGRDWVPAQIGDLVVHLRRLPKTVHPLINRYLADGKPLPPCPTDALPAHPVQFRFDGRTFVPSGVRLAAVKGNLWTVECGSAMADLPAYLAQKCLALIDWCEAFQRGLASVTDAYRRFVRTGEPRMRWVEVGKAAGSYGVVDPRTARALLDAGLATDEVTDNNQWRIRLADLAGE